MIIILKSGDSPVTIVPGEGGVSVVCGAGMATSSADPAAAIIRKQGRPPHPADRHMPVPQGKRRLGVGLCLLSFCLIGLAFGRGLLSGHASPSVSPAAPAHNVAGPQRHAEDLPFPPPAPGVPRTSDPAPSRPDTPATVNTPFGLQ